MAIYALMKMVKTSIKRYTNHGAVYLLIELFTIVVGTQMMFGWHWRREAFAVLHPKFLQAIFEVLLLRYE